MKRMMPGGFHIHDAPPGDGETAVYFFTETAADVLLVARKVVTRIETEGEG